MDKKKFIKEHNEFIDDFYAELFAFAKRYWELFKQPKFWLFYLTSMATIGICYYLGTLF